MQQWPLPALESLVLIALDHGSEFGRFYSSSLTRLSLDCGFPFEVVEDAGGLWESKFKDLPQARVHELLRIIGF